jgi:hypothetical protein
MTDLLEGDVDLTEFELLDVQRVQGVGKGANGFPHLLMKGLPADPEQEPDGEPEPDAAARAAAAIAKAVTDGKVDEAPDIDLGQQVMRLLGQAIGNEAAEIVAGSYGETRDVTMLTRAADLVSCWIAREQAVAAGQDPDAPCGCCSWCDGIGCGCCIGCGPGAVMCAAADEAAEKALLSAKERNNLPDSAFAYIEDGGKKDADGKTTPRSKRHFPIHDKAHADNAMARIEQGAQFGEQAKRKVKAAQKKFGESGDGDAGKSVVAEGETVVNDETQDPGSLTKAVADAVTEALAPHKAEIESLRGELAKVLALPKPGGPVMSVTRPQAERPAAADGPAWKSDPVYLRQMADSVSDPQVADGYRELARKAEEAGPAT